MRIPKLSNFPLSFIEEVKYKVTWQSRQVNYLGRPMLSYSIPIPRPPLPSLSIERGKAKDCLKPEVSPELYRNDRSVNVIKLKVRHTTRIRLVYTKQWMEESGVQRSRMG